jgi:hypothetical protein
MAMLDNSLVYVMASGALSLSAHQLCWLRSPFAVRAGND